MRAAALFASWLQPSEALTTGRVEEAVVWAVRQLGVGGCAGRMAQEFGDHPEAAAERMRRVAAAASTIQAAGRVQRPILVLAGRRRERREGRA